MANKKTTTASKKKQTKVYNCDDVELYLNKAINRVKKEILPKIEILDHRDKDQYESAKKIMMDAAMLAKVKQESVEETVVKVKNELDVIINKQDTIVSDINGLLTGLHTKLDAHISDEANTFKEIQASLFDIGEHGTKLAREIDSKLNDIQVNGGSYPLNEALRHIYSQHTETHNKLNEVITLVEPIQARRRWMRASQELIKKNGVLHFIFSTKIGAILATITLLLIINTILVDVFNVNFDLVSIFKWLGTIFKVAS
jgi:hypothetical protein